MEKWKSAANYMGQEYSNYYVLLGRSRDSGILTNSNFDTALRELKAAGFDNGAIADNENVIVARSSHWAVGWVEFIGIRDDCLDAIKIGENIEARLADYPVLNEDDYSQRQDEQAREYWKYLSVKEKNALKKKYHVETRKLNYADVMSTDNGGLYEYLTQD